VRDYRVRPHAKPSYDFQVSNYAGHEPENLDASPAPLHPSLAVPFLGLGLIMGRLATPSECWEQVALCRTRADAAADERLRAVWSSMAQMWTKLGERLQRLNAQGSV
jgi:hypothetical protein